MIFFLPNNLNFFFPNTRNSTLTFFSPLYTLKIFIRTLTFFFTKHLDFFSLSSIHRHLTFFLDFKKNLANVHPRTIDKFLSNIECNWHRNSFIIEITQSNIIEFIATRHTHTRTFFFGQKKYELRTLNSIE